MTLNEADRQTGDLKGINKDNIQKVPWLWYLYPQSPDMTHDLPATLPLEWHHDDAIKEIFYRDYIRPIAIVSQEGIEEFLNASTWDKFVFSSK